MIKVKSLSDRVLVVGAYGLIGQGIAEKFISKGYRVTGLGRDLYTANRVLPNIPWIKRDIRSLDDDAAWRTILGGFSTVVNCSGALQDGPDDDLEAVHHYAVAALAMACAAEDIALIQISAVGACPDASTPFLASKGRGEAAIRAAGGNWHIFSSRPGPLHRMPMAAQPCSACWQHFPGFSQLPSRTQKYRQSHVTTLPTVVMAAANRKIPHGFEADLVEPKPHSLREVVEHIRHWLGFRPARFEIVLPDFGLAAVSKLADFLSCLGWRSPLRSTAVKVLN